jgi:hypothetical protein
VREQRVVLEHHADPAPLRRHPGPVAGDGLRPSISMVPASGTLEAGEQPQHRRLAAARGAEQREMSSPSVDVEVDAVHGHDVAEGACDAAGGEPLTRMTVSATRLMGSHAAAAASGKVSCEESGSLRGRAGRRAACPTGDEQQRRGRRAGEERLAVASTLRWRASGSRWDRAGASPAAPSWRSGTPARPGETPGRTSGAVTDSRVPGPAAPRPRAASSSEGGTCSSEARIAPTACGRNSTT